MATASEWLLAHVENDHTRLLSRLGSLDNCLDTILYRGESWPRQRGYGALQIRCQELLDTLRAHIPAEEELFDKLAGHGDMRALLIRLREEHEALLGLLEEILGSLEKTLRGESSADDLVTLQAKARALSGALQDHIDLENRMVLPQVEAT